MAQTTAASRRVGHDRVGSRELRRSPTDVVNWKRARAIFDSVVELAPAERRARLALICGDDLALRQEVESLLTHDQSPRDVVGQLVADAARAVTEADDPLRSGQTLLHYGLTWKIGQGGMGVVWKASDFTLGREVAIKVLPADVARDPVRLARFEREAKLLAALNHPNIAGIYSLHEDAGVRFLAMEFVAGDDLSVRLTRGPLALAEVLQVSRQIAEALEEAHEKGIVHRDLKPGNVKVKADGTVKVLDFGLAKALADEAPGPAPTGPAPSDPWGTPGAADLATRAGVILGTPAYMPPEQARGLAVDKRADIWAFGVMLFEMLSGARPFAGATVTDVLAAVVSAEPDWTRLPAGTPVALVQLTRRCLQKDARQRLRDIGEARIAIARLAREDEDAPPAAPPRRRAVTVWAGVAAAALVVALGLASGIGRGSGPAAVPGGTRSIAVLPLVDLSADHSQEYFADGLTEDLLGRLARNPQLRVAGRTSAFQFKRAPQDPRTIGRALGVSALLEGSVRRSGNRVRITAQLVNAADGFHLWSESYDRELDDIFAVQDEIARAVAGALQIALLGDAPAAGVPRGASGPAYNAYLQGKYFRQLNTKDSLDQAVGYLQEATTVDPAFAPAWAGLSLAWATIGSESYAPLDTAFGEARRAAERAVALDSQLAEAHTALSAVRRVYDWDWAGADAAVQRALHLEPNNAEIVLSAARMASTLGRLDEALALTRRAATLDPLNVMVHFRLARYESYAGQLDAARRSYTRTLELNPAYPAAHQGLALTLLGQGHTAEALTELAREPQPLWRGFGEALAYHRLGRQAEADAALAQFIAQFQDVASAQIAQVYAQRGQLDESLAWLDRAYQLRDPGLSQQTVVPEFARFTREPRYRAFLDKMRLPR